MAHAVFGCCLTCFVSRNFKERQPDKDDGRCDRYWTDETHKKSHQTREADQYLEERGYHDSTLDLKGKHQEVFYTITYYRTLLRADQGTWGITISRQTNNLFGTFTYCDWRSVVYCPISILRLLSLSERKKWINSSKTGPYWTIV